MKRVISTCLTLCLSAALALPASALDYSIDAPGNPDYGDPTSIEVVHTADGGAMKNEDRRMGPQSAAYRWLSRLRPALPVYGGANGHPLCRRREMGHPPSL